MFKIGEDIIHGSSGVCRVANVGTLSTGVKGKMYYTLIPYYVKGSCDARELVKIIKTIYLRGKSRIEEGKKLTYSDEKYYKMAEDNFYGEVAVTLSMTKEEAKAFIEEKVEEKAAD